MPDGRATEPLSPDHPLLPLPDTLPAEAFVVAGIRCAVRRSPLGRDELVERSRLCSQPAFQYYLTLDGVTEPSYAARLRTLRGRSGTRLCAGLFHPDLVAAEGVGEEPMFRRAFTDYVSEVVGRRRQMGKPP